VGLRDNFGLRDFNDYLSHVMSGGELTFDHYMILAGNGASPQTTRQMLQDPDLDKGLVQPVQPQPVQPLGQDPTKRVTQEQYDQMLKIQKAKQEEAYQAWKRGK
jgi:hypothetical protein